MSRLRPLLGLLLVLGGCSSTYHLRLSDDRSASYGELFFFGWADPPLIPGTRLVDTPAGSRVVLWNEAGFEAIVDLGDFCPVIVRDDKAARAPTDVELAVISAVFPDWPVVASAGAAEYANERRLERKFPSHVRAQFDALDPASRVEAALSRSAVLERAYYGLSGLLANAAVGASPAARSRILDRTLELGASERTPVLWALVEPRDLESAFLIRIARAGGPEFAAGHPAADESVCLAAIEEIAKFPLSSERRTGLEAVLNSPGVTARVREAALEVPLAYPEDREAVRAKASAENGKR